MPFRSLYTKLVGFSNRKTVFKLFFCLLIVLFCIHTWIYQKHTRIPESVTLRRFDQCVQHALREQSYRCPWPPRDWHDLVNPKTGRLDLTLRPAVDPVKGNRDRTHEHMEFLRSITKEIEPKGSILNQLVQLDSELKMLKQETNYNLYPLVIDMPRLVRDIRTGVPVGPEPINDPVLELIRTPRGVCTEPGLKYTLDLVVIIKVCPTCFSERQHARETYMRKEFWPQFRIQFTFVTGIPVHSADVNSSVVDGELKIYHGRNENKLQPNETLRKLLEESEKYNDLLIGDFADTYYNLTLKQMTSLRWLASVCNEQSSFYMFLDSDYSLIPATTIRVLRRIPLHARSYVNLGTYGPDRTVLHKTGIMNRYGVSPNEIPWKSYAPYSSGAAYILGAQLVKDAAIATAFTRYYRLDDAYLGLIWSKLNLQVYRFHPMRHALKKEEDIKMVMSAPTKSVDSIVNWIA